MTADDQAALPKGWEIGPLIEVAQINPPLGRHILGDHVPVTFVPMRAVGAEGGGLTKPEIRPYGKVKQGYTAFLSGRCDHGQDNSLYGEWKNDGCA